MLTFRPGGCNEQLFASGHRWLVVVCFGVCCFCRKAEELNIPEPIRTDDLDVTFNSKETQGLGPLHVYSCSNRI